MKKIVVDMQNFLFADSIATAFKNSDYDIAGSCGVPARYH